MANDSVNDLIQSIAVKKRTPKDWAYMHLKPGDKNSTTSADEMERMLRARFHGIELETFRFDTRKEVVMLADNRNKQAINLFEKAIFDRFGGTTVRISFGDLQETGLDQLAKIVAKIAPDDDEISRIGLIRMGRPSNAVLVLDDDLMVLKMFEKVLKGFGFVGVTSNTEEFFELYKTYAPNIVFVDIHLKGDKGPNVVRSVRARFDPHVHAVMISGDSSKDTVLGVRDAGAKGFIVKPFNRDSVYQNLLKSPTFIAKVY